MNRLLFFLLVFVYSQAGAQTNLGQTWNVGLYGYKVKFMTGTIFHDTVYGSNVFLRGHSNICVSNGNILFACDGMNVYDKYWNLMQDGDTLVPKAWSEFNQNHSSYSDASLILPFNYGMYYIITPALNDTQLFNTINLPFYNGSGSYNMLYYHLIDMNQNNGNGKVIKPMVPFFQNKFLSKTQMMACRHANGKDWWLLKMAGDSNLVYKFLFTQDSVYDKGLQVIPYPWRGKNDLYGQMVFNRNGTKWATTYSNYYGEVYLGDFDRCTGQLSNFDRILVPPQLSGYSSPSSVEDTNNTGLCFSPSSNLLYIARTTHVMQYDILTQTFYKVCGWDTTENVFAKYSSLMLAKNDHIYIGNLHGTSKQMSVIDNPDVPGPGCNFCRKCLRSKSVYGFMSSPPCMPNYELGASGQTCWPLDNAETVKVDGFWEVYPNPSRTVMYIKHKTGKKKDLFSVVGELLYCTTRDEIDVSAYTKGVYFLRCGDGAVKKVVVE